MKLTKEEIQKLIYCIDLIIQNFGENKELDELANKLIKMIDTANSPLDTTGIDLDVIEGQTTVFDYI